jgi:protein-tyrosine phosphatase
LFDENYEWVTKMRQQNKKVLFHCAAGVSRSASFVIAYLMKDQGISYQEAFNFVKSKRSIIRPNSGFVQQLS